MLKPHNATRPRSEWVWIHCEKHSTIIVILLLLSERYAPKSWLCWVSQARSVWHSKLKTNQTDIALNTAFIVSPYLEMFTSSWWLTEVGRRDVSHFSCTRLFRSERSCLSGCRLVKLAVFSVLLRFKEFVSIILFKVLSTFYIITARFKSWLIFNYSVLGKKAKWSLYSFIFNTFLCWGYWSGLFPSYATVCPRKCTFTKYFSYKRNNCLFFSVYSYCVFIVCWTYVFLNTASCYSWISSKCCLQVNKNCLAL